MYICYVDESGHCGKRENPDQPVEVLCAVVSNLAKVTKTHREHAELLAALGIDELKASEAYRGRKDWEGVPAAERDRLFQQILDWCNERKCRFVPSPVDAARFFARKRAACRFSTRLGSPWEAAALHILLALQRMQKRQKSNKGRTVVVFDEQDTHGENLLRILEGDLSFTDGYTGHNPRRKKERRLDQIMDVPFFSKSHLAILIQIADWAAFVLNNHLQLRLYGRTEKYPGEAAKFEGWARGIARMCPEASALDPRVKDELVDYFRAIRPSGWAPKTWLDSLSTTPASDGIGVQVDEAASATLTASDVTVGQGVASGHADQRPPV